MVGKNKREIPLAHDDVISGLAGVSQSAKYRRRRSILKSCKCWRFNSSSKCCNGSTSNCNLWPSRNEIKAQFFPQLAQLLDIYMYIWGSYLRQQPTKSTTSHQQWKAPHTKRRQGKTGRKTWEVCMEHNEISNSDPLALNVSPTMNVVTSYANVPKGVCMMM